MARKDADEWQKAIMQMHSALQADEDLGEVARNVVTLDQQSIGRISRMDALQAQAMAKAAQVRIRNRKHRLESALKRIAAGDFGYCEECGEEIPEARLLLDPGYSLCVSCTAGN